MRNESLRIASMKEHLQMFSLRLLASLRHFLQLMGQRHEPAPVPAPLRQPRH